MVLLEIFHPFSWQILVLLEFVTNLSFPNIFKSKEREIQAVVSIVDTKYGDSQVNSTSPKKCDDGVGGADVPRTQRAVKGKELLQ